MKTTLCVEYQGRQVEDKTLISQVKALWIESGYKVKDMKELKIYIKPEESAAYYVINGDFTGSIKLD